MATNRFTQHIDLQRKLAQADQQAYQKSTDYLLTASLEYDGSPLRLLLDKSQIQIAREFMSLMAKHDFPLTFGLKLEAKVVRAPLDEYELNRGSWSYKKRQQFINNLKWQKLWLGYGYMIGVLTDSPAVFMHEPNCTPVFLCSDLKLRCRRSTPVFKAGQSYTSGDGNLPVDELHLYKFYVGKFVRLNDESKSTIFREENLETLLMTMTEERLLKTA